MGREPVADIRKVDCIEPEVIIKIYGIGHDRMLELYPQHFDGKKWELNGLSLSYLTKIPTDRLRNEVGEVLANIGVHPDDAKDVFKTPCWNGDLIRKEKRRERRQRDRERKTQETIDRCTRDFGYDFNVRL